MTRTAVLICPGRGTYNRTELGYLSRHHSDKASLLAGFDAIRESERQEPVSALDAAGTFRAALHTRSDVASPLIYASSLADARSLAGDIDIVAVTGNSMGWYTALAAGGALTEDDGFRVVNTMGRLMHKRGAGGQLVYPHVGPDWRPDPVRKAELLDLVAELGARDGQKLDLSIDLGGLLVVAGDEAGLAAFEAALPRLDDRFPMRLANHAAFHTALVQRVSEAGRAALSPSMFGQPRLPLVDGRGHVWWPGACDPWAIWDYTLGAQVLTAYDFTGAIRTAAREFAPDLFIIAGPGTTMGGAVAQSLIQCAWRDMDDKAAFEALQQKSGLLAAMGRNDQRAWVT